MPGRKGRKRKQASAAPKEVAKPAEAAVAIGDTSSTKVEEPEKQPEPKPEFTQLKCTDDQASAGWANLCGTIIPPSSAGGS